MNHSARLLSLLLLVPGTALGSGCAVLPGARDVDARELISRGELLDALLTLERIAPGDPSHDEARGLAAAVEARIRVAEDHVRRGLAQRAERQDEQAAQSFSEALAAWPRCDAAHALLRSSRARLASSRLSHAGPAPPAPEADVAEPSPVAPGPIATEAPPASPSAASRPAAVYLEQDPQRASRLKSARTLSQRALVRYGRGELAEAISTWHSVLKIIPDDPLTLEYLRAAQKELGGAKEASPLR